MKKGFKAAAILLCIVMAAAGLAGCKKEEEKKAITAAELMGKVRNREVTSQSMHLTLDMDMEMKFSVSSYAMKMNLDGNLDVEIGKKSHTVSTLNVDSEGETQTQENELYSVVEDGEGKIYTNIYGTWFYYNTDASVLSLNGTGDVTSADLDWQLAEETVKVGEKDAYVVSGVVTGEEALKVMSTTMSAEDLEAVMGAELSDSDFSKLVINLTCYIDAETEDTLLKAEIDCGNSLIDVMGEAGSMMDEDSRINLKMTMDDIVYDNVTITIPDEVLAADNGSSAMPETEDSGTEEYLQLAAEINEAGEFTLTSDYTTSALTMKNPEGMICEFASQDSVTFYNDNFTDDVTFYLMEKAFVPTEEAALDSVDEWVESMEAEDAYTNIVVGEVQHTEYNGKDLIWRTVNYDAESAGAVSMIVAVVPFEDTFMMIGRNTLNYDGEMTCADTILPLLEGMTDTAKEAPGLDMIDTQETWAEETSAAG